MSTVSAAPLAAEEADKAEGPKIEDVIKDATKIEGLLTLYRKKESLLAELSTSQFDKDFLVLISIARGVGESYLLGGMSWGFGDDWLWQFRKAGDDNVHLVRVNTRFSADPGSPEAEAVATAYNDSVLFNLPIVAKGGGKVLVDLSPVFLSDLPQISLVMPEFRFADDRSSFAEVKGFTDNCELQVDATYASRGSAQFDTVPDSRGMTLTVHYSISQLPSTGYQPRVADDRVGYFLTVSKNFSSNDGEERFVRYINRWDLQKADPKAELSPPKRPIVFWLENSIPYEYRKPIREGILAWNSAFEKAGFLDAIEVRQQPPGAEWDPEDVNYNTFRWITAGAGFAMGPSRVNPRTGQILDADIIFDADFVEYWKHEYETFTPDAIATMTGGPLNLEAYHAQQERLPSWARHASSCRCELTHGFGQQLAFGHSVLAARYGVASDKRKEELILQGLKEVTMHEVGHTLGLRHNFKASTFLSLEEMNDPEKTRTTGLTASVMDYAPVNIVPEGQPQGDYYSQTIGPYDHWAIEYGYKPLTGGTEGEGTDLKAIAAKGAELGLDFATDEDTRGIDSDPLANRFDLGKDPMAYAKRQAELVQQLWPTVIERTVEDGDGYQKARQAFGVLLSTHGRSMYFAARNIGGLYVHRDHKGDAKGRDPFVVVSADDQRKALNLLSEQVFSDTPFDFPPEFYNKLASTRWSHWGVQSADRLDLPVHEYIGMWQDRILAQVLSPLTLSRLHDSELKVPVDQDCLTVPELFGSLSDSIFAETRDLEPGEYSAREPAVSSLRRNLQRMYLKRLADLSLGKSGAPEDVQTVAFLELTDIQGELQKALVREETKLDPYTRAHYLDSIQRVGSVLEARVTTSGF